MTRVAFPRMPETEIASIAALEDTLREELFAMLCSQVSPARCAHAMYRQHAVLLPVADITAFQQEIPEDLFLGESALAQAQQNIDVMLDPIQMLSRLLFQDYKALEALILAMQLSPDSGPTADEVDQRMDRFFERVQQYVQLRQKLGELPTEPLKIDLHKMEEPLPSVEELLGA